MAGVQRDGGHARNGPESTPAPATNAVNHLKVTPDNVLSLAQTFAAIADDLDQATQNMVADLTLPDDAFLGDPFSKQAIKGFNDYFVHNDNSVVNTLTELIHEHMRTFNALKAIAEGYGMTDEWNAKGLGEVYKFS